MDMYMCVYVCVSLFFVVWCRVMSCVARRCWLGGWAWCGAVDMSLSFLFRMMSSLQRARAERSMIELAPFSIFVRPKM